MRIVPLEEMKAKLGAYIDECATNGPIVITRNGETAVLLVHHDDDDLGQILLGRSPRFQAMLDRSRQSIERGRGLSEGALWKATRERTQEQKPSAGRPTGRENDK